MIDLHESNWKIITIRKVGRKYELVCKVSRAYKIDRFTNKGMYTLLYTIRDYINDPTINHEGKLLKYIFVQFKKRFIARIKIIVHNS